MEAIQVGGHLDSYWSTMLTGFFVSYWSTLLTGFGLLVLWSTVICRALACDRIISLQTVRPSSSSIYSPQPTGFLSGAWQWSWAQRLSPDYPISNEPIICRNLFALMVLICLLFPHLAFLSFGSSAIDLQTWRVRGKSCPEGRFISWCVWPGGNATTRGEWGSMLKMMMGELIAVKKVRHKTYKSKMVYQFRPLSSTFILESAPVTRFMWLSLQDCLRADM